MHDKPRIRALAAELISIGERLSADADLADWVHTERRKHADGFPRRSPGSSDPRRGGELPYADPAGDVATSATAADHQLDRLMRKIASAVGEARGADAARIELDRLRYPPDPKPETRSLPDCANIHGCPDGALATGDSGRCGTCANYRRTHDGLDRRYKYDRQAI